VQNKIFFRTLSPVVWNINDAMEHDSSRMIVQFVRKQRTTTSFIVLPGWPCFLREPCLHELLSLCARVYSAREMCSARQK